MCCAVLLAQSCLTLCNPVDCSLPGASVPGILQGRILEWVAVSFSRGSSWPRDWTCISCISGRFFTSWANSQAHFIHSSVCILYIAVYICQSFNSSRPWAFLRSVSSSSELSNVRGALWGLLNFQPSWTEERVALGPVAVTWSGSRLVELSPSLWGSALTLGS